MEDKRRRLYEVTIYEDMIDAIYFAEKLDKCSYYYILHDKDKYSEETDEHKQGDIKKPHHHLLLYFNDGITLKSLCKKLNIEGKENYVKFWSSKDPKGRKDYRIRYLIHYKSQDPFRHEYGIEEIKTNDNTISKYFTDDESKQNQDIILLFDYFDSRENNLVSYRSFLGYVFEQGLWGTYQRNALTFNRLLDEHNNSVKEEMLEVFK